MKINVFRCEAFYMTQKIKQAKRSNYNYFRHYQLINEREIHIGQKSAVFSLKINRDYDFYNQCIADTDDICFPLLDFQSIMTACYFNDKIIQEHQDNLKFEIPFAQESKTLIETNRIIKLKSFNFVNAEITDSLYCPKIAMNVNVSQPTPHSYPMTSDTGCMQAESQSAQQESGVQAKC